MKKFSSLIIILIALCFTKVIAQETTIPSWPCTPGAAYSVQYTNTTLTLKVLLVEFDDIKHRNPSQDSKPAYTFDDFENLLFSDGYYVSPNAYSPDNKQVFGSLHDYYEIMSNGDLNITGSILNDDANSDNIPDWLVLDYDKAYYQDAAYTTFIAEVESKASSAGITIGTLDDTNKLVIIYAGHTYRRKTDGTTSPCGLTPRAIGGPGGLKYIMAEQFAPYAPYHYEHPTRNFSHIGIHAHELGHLLGYDDTYSDFNYSNNGFWGLMASGNYNGPEYSGACPAPINPQQRFNSGWLSFTNVTTNSNYQADYSLSSPEIFKVTSSSDSDDYFLIECRRFDTNMTIGSTNCLDYNSYVPHGSQEQGILVWRIDDNGSPKAQILHANGEEWDIATLGIKGIEGDIYPGPDDFRVLSPWSHPGTTSATNNWIPNTTTSTNCSMEITNIGTGYYNIDLYISNPEDASPAKPMSRAIKTSQPGPLKPATCFDCKCNFSD